MTIGGFQPFSMNEFPGRISAIVFLQGCNLRCPYCHNPELVDPARFTHPWHEEEVMGELSRRAGKVQGVVLTGGEATLQEDLEEAIDRLRALGLEVKLDTNGTHPEVLERLIERRVLCHVGLDVKAPPWKYRELTRSQVDPALIERSLALLVSSGLPHEIRTTWLPSLLSADEMLEIAEWVRGCAAWVVQRFVPSKALEPAVLRETPPSGEQMERLRRAAEALGIHCIVR